MKLTNNNLLLIKRVFLILILTLSFQSFTKANDIRDFEIDGISIGDDLLNFFSEDQIKKNILPDQYPKNNSIKRVAFKLKNKVFEDLMIHYKKDNKKFIVYGILGSLTFQNFSNCYIKSKEISADVQKLFPNIEVDIYEKKHAADKTGKSTNKGYTYWLSDQSYVNIACYDWSKKMGYKDHLRLEIVGEEFQKFLKLNFD